MDASVKSRNGSLRKGGRGAVAVRVVIGLILARSCLVAAVSVAQDAPAPSASSVSTELQPKLQPLTQVIAGLEVDRWKATRQVKDTMAANIESMRKDLSQTLPGLLATADASPDSLTALLPVSRNISALYDVVLRVTVVADNAAPQPQAQAMAEALAGLDAGRRGMNERVQKAAEGQQAQMAELRKTLATLKISAAAPVPPLPAPVCPAPVVKKKKPAPKPAPKPATPPPGQN